MTRKSDAEIFGELLRVYACLIFKFPPDFIGEIATSSKPIKNGLMAAG